MTASGLVPRHAACVSPVSLPSLFSGGVQAGADHISPDEVCGLLKEILGALPANANVVESVTRALETVAKAGGDSAVQVMLSSGLVQLLSRSHEAAKHTANVEEALAAGVQSNNSAEYDPARHQAAQKVAGLLKATLHTVSVSSIAAMPTLLSTGDVTANNAALGDVLVASTIASQQTTVDDALNQDEADLRDALLAIARGPNGVQAMWNLLEDGFGDGSALRDVPTNSLTKVCGTPPVVFVLLNSNTHSRLRYTRNVVVGRQLACCLLRLLTCLGGCAGVCQASRFRVLHEVMRTLESVYQTEDADNIQPAAYSDPQWVASLFAVLKTANAVVVKSKKKAVKPADGDAEGGSSSGSGAAGGDGAAAAGATPGAGESPTSGGGGGEGGNASTSHRGLLLLARLCACDRPCFC